MRWEKARQLFLHIFNFENINTQDENLFVVASRKKAFGREEIDTEAVDFGQGIREAAVQRGKVQDRQFHSLLTGLINW